MSKIDIEYPDHITLLQGIKPNRYCAAIMHWDSIEEMYRPTWMSKYTSKEAAMKEAAIQADIYKLEVIV